MKRRTLKSRLLAFLLVLCMVAGLTPVYAVTEGDFEAFVVNETKVVTLEGGASCSYTFTPDEDGTYILYRPNNAWYFDLSINSSDWMVNDWRWNSATATGIIYYNMKTGSQYEIKLQNWSSAAQTADISLIKAMPAAAQRIPPAFCTQAFLR